MRALFPLLPCVLFSVHVRAQEPYFPPLTGDTWETLDPAQLGWCMDSIDALYDFLDAHHTKAFLLLKDGRIVLEHYFGTFTADSLWYWASAGKTLTSTLVGIAQEEGHLDLDAPTSQYLGTGWTSTAPEQEALTTVRHQLTMTTGLDDGGLDADCTLPACLGFEADAGTRWAYHNAPYTLLDDVVANATGNSFAAYFNSRIRDRIGMDGLWLPLGSPFNNVYVSRARSMARYGLLALNGMIWDQDTILHDAAYFTAATTPSQALNPSYGYLWWLNGQSSFMLPTLQFVFPGPLMPHAPPDLFCGLGKNDQLLNVVPAQGLVLVRMGDPAYTGQSVAIVLNDEIWARIATLGCATTGIAAPIKVEPRAMFDPATERVLFTVPHDASGWRVTLHDATGRTLLRSAATTPLDISAWPRGAYILRVINGAHAATFRFVKP